MDCPLTDVVPNEVTLLISSFLTSNTDLKNFAVTCHKHFGVLIKQLYTRDIKSGQNDSLEWASRTGQLSALKRALSIGASINQFFDTPFPNHYIWHETMMESRKTSAQTPLIVAIRYQQWEIVHHLLGEGADLGLCDRYYPQFFPLQWLLDWDLPWSLERVRVFKRVLDLGADPNGLANGRIGDLPLPLALRTPAPPKIVWLLLEKGADIRNAFGPANAEGQLSMLRFYPTVCLSRKNISQEWFQKFRYILQHYRKDLDSHDWYDPLPPAATTPKAMNKQFLEFLLEEGYRPHGKSLVDVAWEVSRLRHWSSSARKQMNRELDGAFRLGAEMIKLLVQAGAAQQQSKADRSAEDETSCLDTALFYLCQCKSEIIDATVLMLLTHGANPNVTDNGGFTPLHHAYMGKMDQRIQYLIKHKANIDARDRFGSTPQQYADSPMPVRLVYPTRPVKSSENINPE
ncbi:ankyrin repeat-containing domain protein [Biscogniauxia marginata]|nr:ankyrin repeat-containing domain protein [Biscogniauxia marginata]